MMEKKKNGWGGPRPNSGRKGCGIERKPVAIRMSAEEVAKFKKLGGVTWFRKILSQS